MPSDKITSTILLFAAAVLSGAILWKAAFMGMTIDEASTYLNYVSGRNLFQALFTPDDAANNHLLNTLLIKGSTLVWKSEFFVRLPNVLAGGLYLCCSFWLVRRYLRSGAVQVAGFALLCLNPYLLDFFSLARGYGLGLGAMIAACSVFLLFFETQRIRYWWLALLGAALAVYANYTWMHFYGALLLTGAALALRGAAPGISLKQLYPGAVVVTSVLALLIYSPLRRVLGGADLDFGGTTGFRTDTLGSLLVNFLAGRELRWQAFDLRGFLEILVFLCVAFAALQTVRYLRRPDPGLRAPVAVSLILFGVLAGHFSQHSAFGLRWMYNRTALLYYPLFAVAAALLLGRSRQSESRFRTAAAWLLTAFLCWNFAQGFHPVQCREWWTERDTKLMLKDVERLQPEGEIRLGLYWPYLPSFGYYQETQQFPRIRNMNWRMDVDTAGTYDFYYIPGDQRALLENRYEPVRQYTEGYLYRLKQ